MEEQEIVNPMSSDCSYKICTNNTCGLGGIRTIEYCYGYSTDDIIDVYCGCTVG